MQRDGDRQKVFTRRAALLAGGKLVLLSTLVGRMYYLQVVESERYATLADENRINIRLLSPPRGRIVDRFGVPVAVNQQNHRVILVPKDAEPIETTLDALGAIIDIGAGERRRILRETRRRRSFIPITVRDNLTWEEVARIEVNTPDLPGIMIDVGRSRHYPHGESIASVLGYVAAVSEDEIDGDPLLQLPGFRIGKAGIEKVYDRALRGTGGSSQVEVNAVGRVIKEIERQEGQPGTEVTLTVDLELQELGNRLLAGESAAAVVLDIHTGDVMAMVSTPGFDPNAFNRGLGADQWKALISNPRAPLVNKAVAGQYAPGSTFKMVVALAALEKGVITSASRIFCSGSLKVGEAEFHCWKRGGHGDVDLKKGITQSCDVFFYEIARRAGIDRIAAMARKFGLGQVLGVDVPGETAGLIPTREWKQATIGGAWHLGETLIAGIGQGAILATPLQLAVMTARIVNGGFAVTPHVTRDIVDGKGAFPRERGGFETLGVSPRHLALVRQGTDGVVNAPMGTAHRARIAEAGLEMGGKTGTVQVRRITKAEREQGVRKNKELAWKDRDHAMFVGYAPVHAPRYAVAVVVEHGGGGSTVAAPIARDLLLATQRRNPIRAATVAGRGG
ncbi:MAG: penicillin-binding protein 2 [Rhodospirillales bacterium]|jgi:penicillin-binding protein 2|nr:penicillin-binding protein 2 [Rhodospirillales bacterium]MDP6883744.1 penicillin-binding protein 2 [Rhodospirillales bacterium]